MKVEYVMPPKSKDSAVGSLYTKSIYLTSRCAYSIHEIPLSSALGHTICFHWQRKQNAISHPAAAIVCSRVHLPATKTSQEAHPSLSHDHMRVAVRTTFTEVAIVIMLNGEHVCMDRRRWGPACGGNYVLLKLRDAIGFHTGFAGVDTVGSALSSSSTMTNCVYLYLALRRRH